LPGTFQRSRIKSLQAQIHHLDKAHHHLELGDIYFQQSKLQQALDCYLRAQEREPADQDIRAHLGQCLLRLNRPAEARPLLETVCAENPRHDYGHSLMALAETYTALGEIDAAIGAWQRVVQENAYARARVQLAELHSAKGDKEAAKAELDEVLRDDMHAPAFQRKRDAVWIKRAKRSLKTL
jgi:tetratricopeptide (TPR) repeat protein